MTTYRLLDTSGAVIATADEPEDLFDAEECGNDDEIANAIAVVAAGALETLIGGGAAPLFLLERVTPEPASLAARLYD